MMPLRQTSQTRSGLRAREFSESGRIFVRCPRPTEQLLVNTLNRIDLELLGTLPAHHGKGAASLQLEWGIGIADKHGLVSWVESSPVAKPLYERFGFIEQDTVESQVVESAGGGTFVHTMMMREPRPYGHN
jgi:hypothetical protein